MRLDRLCLLLLFAVILAGCGNGETLPTPTQAAVVQPTSDPDVVLLRQTEAAKLTAANIATPTPVCTSDLTFVDDVTIPDGTVVEPGEQLDKRWRVENSGSCNWDHRYEIRLIAGPQMEATSPQSLYPALSDTETEIRIVYTAPEEPGAYRSAWQAFDPSGTAFGDIFFIDIVVAVQEEPTETPEG
jgi:hypothetical protein